MRVKNCKKNMKRMMRMEVKERHKMAKHLGGTTVEHPQSQF